MVRWCRVFALLGLMLAGPAWANTVFLASAARTTSGTAVVPGNFSQLEGAVVLLDVTAAATDVGDTLDVFLQSSVDGGTTWNDFAHFTQVLGNGGAKKFLAGWSGLVTAETEQAAPADGSLAAGVLQGPVGETWRVKWVIVDAGTVNASFTFAVTATLRWGVLR